MAIKQWNLTLNFDSGIDNVKFNYGSNEHIFSTSGEIYTVGYEPGNNVTLTVTLKDGYSLDTAVNNSGVAVGTINGNVVTIPEPESGFNYTWILTSKQAVSKVSIDLTTLSGWDNVASGEHQISVVAKASGYLDSEKSIAVTFNKASVSTGETWVLNDILSFGIKNWSYNVNFTSNGNSYNTFAFNFLSPLEAYLVYDSTNVYDANSYVWTNTAYKTITFDTAPTGNLLTWLQANGTKQGGTVTHTLTNTSSAVASIKVNGKSVTLPYILKNGDIIIVQSTDFYGFSVNGETYYKDATINLSNTDISLSGSVPNKAMLNNYIIVTINYTE